MRCDLNLKLEKREALCIVVGGIEKTKQKKVDVVRTQYTRGDDQLMKMKNMKSKIHCHNCTCGAKKLVRKGQKNTLEYL